MFPPSAIKLKFLIIAACALQAGGESRDPESCDAVD